MAQTQKPPMKRNRIVQIRFPDDVESSNRLFSTLSDSSILIYALTQQKHRVLYRRVLPLYLCPAPHTIISHV